MKQKHTKAKKANRISGFSKVPNYTYSVRRVLKREEFQPQKRKNYGLQIKRIQAIKKEKYNGVRYTIIINIEHAV
jgi:hypothetical protein